MRRPHLWLIAGVLFWSLLLGAFAASIKRQPPVLPERVSVLAVQVLGDGHAVVITADRVDYCGRGELLAVLVTPDRTGEAGCWSAEGERVRVRWIERDTVALYAAVAFVRPGVKQSPAVQISGVRDA